MWRRGLPRWSSPAVLFVVNIGGFVSGSCSTGPGCLKVALIGLVERLRDSGQPVLLDAVAHQASGIPKGVVDVPRPHYLARLRQVIDLPDVW